MIAKYAIDEYMALQYRVVGGRHDGQVVVVGVWAVFVHPCPGRGMGGIETVEESVECGRPDRQKITCAPINQFVRAQHLHGVTGGLAGQGQVLNGKAVAESVGWK